jgi:ribosomal protein L7/L12
MFTQLEMYLGVGILAVVLALGGGVYYYHSALEKEKTAYAVLESSNKTYLDTIKSNTKIIDDNLKDAKVREEAGKVLLLEAQKNARVYQAKAQDILSTIPKGEDECKSTEALLNDYISGQLK